MGKYWPGLLDSQPQPYMSLFVNINLVRREIADVESVQDCGVACNIGNVQFCNALHYDKTTRICHMFNVNFIGMFV